MILSAGIFWIFFNDSVPAYDQKNGVYGSSTDCGILEMVPIALSQICLKQRSVIISV